MHDAALRSKDHMLKNADLYRTAACNSQAKVFDALSTNSST
jgi:hypothetical protein